MTEQTVAIYCLVSDLCRHLLPATTRPHAQRRLTDAQILTTAVVAARFFGGNLFQAQQYMQAHHGQAPLDKSGFSRRLHALADTLQTLFAGLGRHLKTLNTSAQYIIDSAPIAVCDNIRIRRSRLVQGEAYRGRCASKRRFFYGFKLQLVTTADGLPVECVFHAGSTADITSLQAAPPDLPPGSVLYADAGYTDYALEDDWLAAENVRLLAARRGNSQRPHEPSVAYLIQHHRKRVETTLSGITALFAKKIHAVTAQGFLIKLLLFVFAYTIQAWLLDE
jgi:hypothetical protein